MVWYVLISCSFIDLHSVGEESFGHRERNRRGRNRPRAVDETHGQGRNHSHE